MNRYIFIFFLLFILSCVSENEEPILNDEINLIVSKELSNEELIEINKTWIKDEAFRIDDFCRRHSWPVKNTQTGPGALNSIFFLLNIGLILIAGCSTVSTRERAEHFQIDWYLRLQATSYVSCIPPDHQHIRVTFCCFL